MPLYECVFIARNDVTQQQVETIAEQVAGLIAEGGGEVKKREYWGLRGLAYKIKKNRKAHYALLNIDAPYAAVAEVERQERLSEDVLRFLTIRVDELEEGPSVMLQKRDRDDRRDDRRGERGERGDRGDRGDRGPRRERGPRRDDTEFGDEENL